MNPLLVRFPSLLTILERARLNRQQFKHLQNEAPIAVEVKTRRKFPDADLHAGYAARTLSASGVVATLMIAGFVGFPEFDVRQMEREQDQVVVQVEDIPETRQVRRPPPPPRPAVPVETEDTDVPDDVTIENTDLDFDDVDLSLPPPPGQMADSQPAEEEPIEFWAVEDKPEIIRQVPPSYPEVARKSGIQGTILVRVLIGANGKVQEAEVLRGKEVFRAAALTAVKKYEFEPARQNDRPVPVWMALPIRFRLVS